MFLPKYSCRDEEIRPKNYAPYFLLPWKTFCPNDLTISARVLEILSSVQVHFRPKLFLFTLPFLNIKYRTSDLFLPTHSLIPKIYLPLSHATPPLLFDTSSSPFSPVALPFYLHLSAPKFYIPSLHPIFLFSPSFHSSNYPLPFQKLKANRLALQFSGIATFRNTSPGDVVHGEPGHFFFFLKTNFPPPPDEAYFPHNKLVCLSKILSVH